MRVRRTVIADTSHFISHRLKGEIHMITIAHQEFCDCGLKLVDFEFNRLRSPLPGGATNKKGCLVCDEFLSGLTEVLAGRTINLQVLRQMRAKRGGGRGRGRGRGGRGRGRSRSGFDAKMSFSDF